MSLSRRHLFALGTGLAGSWALAGCSAGSAPAGGAQSSAAQAGGVSSGGVSTVVASAPVSTAGASATIGLTYIPNIQFAPFYLAQAQGGYAGTGTAVTLRHHGASEGLFTALTSGQEHLVVAGLDEMTQAVAQGADLVALAQYYRTYPVVAIVKDASSIRSAADLKGHSIGVPGRYGETWFGLQALLSAGGLAQTDVKVTEIGYTQLAALMSGQVDAVMGFSNNDVVAFGAAGLPVRSIALGADAPLIGIGLVAERSWATAHADVAKRIVDATTAGFAATASDQAAALAATAQHVPTLATDAQARSSAEKVLAATVPLYKDASGAITARMDGARFAAMASFMAARGLLAAGSGGSSSVDASRLFSNDFHTK